MANTYTDTSAGVWQALSQTAYDLEVNYQLRNMPVWRQLVDYRPQRPSMNAGAVVLSFLNEFTALATTPLTETVDPDAVAPPVPTQRTITLNEYGNTTLQTRKLLDFSFMENPGPDAGLANLIAKNMADTLDALVQAVIDASTNIIYVNGTVDQDATTTVVGTEGAVAATDVLQSKEIAAATALLRRRKVSARDVSGNYLAMIHPDVAVDVRRESATNAWVAPHAYVDPAGIYNAEIGTFAGARFIETTRVRTASDGASGAKVYSTYFLGMNAVAEAVAEEPHVVIGNQTDKLNRFFPVGWYANLGWVLYRPEAVQVVRSSSSIAKL